MLLLDTRAETILEHIDDGFVAVDSQWHYIYVNTKAESILRKRRTDLLGREVAEVFPHVVYTPFTSKCLQAMEAREIVEFENYCESLSTWMHIRACPVDDGLFIYFNGISSKQASQRADEGLALLFEQAPFGFAFLDTNLRYRYINQQMALINKRPVEEHIGKTLQEVLRIDSVEFIKIMRSVLDKDEPVLDMEFSGAPHPETGAVRYWLINYYPVHSHMDEQLGVSAFVLDITRRKTLELRRDEFINMASHELKTPLTSIKTMIQMLRRKLAKQCLQEHVAALTRMDAQVNTLANLIRELLDVSKMRAGKLEHFNGQVDINELLVELVEMLQPCALEHKIILTGQASRFVRGDRERLMQVFTNLLTNAIKYSPGAEYVRIHIDTSEDSVIVSVRDYGIGIPKEVQKSIFERFYRAQKVRDDNFPGLGIGLYIVAAIVKQHGGTITVESEEGQGSTFSVSLPSIE